MPKFKVQITRSISTEVEVEAADAAAAVEIINKVDYPLPPREEWNGSKDFEYEVSDDQEPDYSHLDDPAERAWLIALKPEDVVKNAHRIYQFMNETGMSADSYTRELAFEKAARALGIEYNTIYDAWLNETPLPQS